MAYLTDLIFRPLWDFSLTRHFHSKVDIITVIIIPKEPIINSIFSPKLIIICFINKPTTNTVLVIKNIKIKTHKKTK